MSEPSKDLFSDFSPASKDDWRKKANEDLKGEDVLQKFSWPVEDDIMALPYYDRTDTGLQKNPHFHNRLFDKDGTTGEVRHWDNLQLIPVVREKNANRQALVALSNGADGIIFDISNKDSIDFSRLLNEILPGYCNISFKTDTRLVELMTEYFTCIEALNIIPERLTGLIISENNVFGIDKLQAYKGIRCINLAAPKGLTFSDAIVEILLQLVSYIEIYLEEGFNIGQITDKCFIPLSISTSYFEEIAKLNVVRRLFYQVVQAYGYKNFLPEDIHIHCRSFAWNDEKYMPHANMLKSTTAAMSAILGGCNSLYVEPENQNDTLMTRIARNVSTILKEEAYLNKTADVVAGSYYLESLIDVMAQKAWTKFQEQIERQKVGINNEA